MMIDVLVFEGCPSGDETWEMARRVAAEECPSAQLCLVDVTDAESAERHRFLGSPSIQIDGQDIETSRVCESVFSYSCRVYRADGTVSGTVPESL